MASSPSPSLRLELMDTGDQSGTWGDTTNVNLGTLLEQAITGYFTFIQTNTTTKVLTNTDYASNETRNMVIEATGTPGGNFAVEVPEAEKVWLFKNSTNQRMEVKTGTQATGVYVAAGTSKWLYCDGTDVGDGLGFYFNSTSGALSPTTANNIALGTTSLPWSDLFLGAGGVINWDSGDVTITQEANALYFAGASTGYRFDALIYPASNDGAALGTGTAAFSDLFLASGGVINFANGDALITHASNALAFTGASNGYSFDAAVLPSADNSAALGAAGTAFADLFLAAGGVINWDSGDVTITEGTNTLTFAGASSGYTFSDGGVVVGAATGGSQGAGTVNATGLYINGAAIGTVTSTTYNLADSPVAWTKPSSGNFIRIQMWGGGGSGGTPKGNGSAGGGGGGGAGFDETFTLSSIASTATITIGAGGAAKTTSGAGNAGGNTTFVHGAVTYTAFGGGAGDGGSDNEGGGGGGGGLLSAGSAGNELVGGAGGKGDGGDGGASAAAANGTAGSEGIYGGGGGGGGTGSGVGGAGGASIYGGGGGGGGTENGSATVGGSSVWGGAGGAGATGTTNATAGSVPGGGGGGAETGNSGAGGNGRVIVTVW